MKREITEKSLHFKMLRDLFDTFDEPEGGLDDWDNHDFSGTANSWYVVGKRYKFCLFVENDFGHYGTHRETIIVTDRAEGR